MSAILLTLRRDGSAAGSQSHAATASAAMLEALAHHGPDGCDSREIGPVRLAHQHWWSTPEERGERQPVADRAGTYLLAFDGRLDNRDELLAMLELADPDLSDARLVLCAFERWGETMLSRLLGPFALVLFDVWQRRLLCARDPMGQRALYYVLSDRYFLAASEESALLAHPEVSQELDEDSVARTFAMRAPRPGSTLFAAVRELLPGQALRVPAAAGDGAEVHSWKFWDPANFRRDLHRCSDQGLAEELRSVLRESVRCRLRGLEAPAVLLSGGLDSTTVAALAAERLESEGRRLKAVSWVFPGLPACDESAYIDLLTARWGLDSHKVSGDSGWPLRDLDSWPVLPSRAYSDPYSRLLEAACGRAREIGATTLLTGYWGGQLYSASSGWLTAMLKAGRWQDAGSSLLAELRQRQLKLPALLGLAGSKLRRSVGLRPADPWLEFLTPACRVRLQENSPAMDSKLGIPGDDRGLLSGFHPWMASGRLGLARRLGVELRDPFRDRRVVELFLNLPAHQLHRGGSQRYITREAMRGLLPEPIRTRRGKTSLLPLFTRGLLERESAAVRTLLDSPEATWRRYLQPERVTAAAELPTARARASEALTVLWLAVSFELWQKALRSSRSNPLDAAGAVIGRDR